MSEKQKSSICIVFEASMQSVWHVNNTMSIKGKSLIRQLLSTAGRTVNGISESKELLVNISVYLPENYK